MMIQEKTLQSFVWDWFKHPNWWFNKNEYNDMYIKNTYEHLLDIIDLDINEYNIIGKILVYDQLPRHVFRNQYANHIITYYLQKAINIVSQNELFSTSKHITDEEFIFFWLPYRHTFEYRYILKVMEHIWRRVNCKGIMSDKIKKFIRATYSNSPHDNQEYNIKYTSTTNISQNIFHKFDYILEYKGDNIIDELNKKNVDIDKINNTLKSIDINENQIIISLSGGVDSMVAMQKLQETNINVVAVHINYCNRETSNDEEDFVKWWCNLRGIPLYIRRIQEINRPLCMQFEIRDIYETYTRNVRYGVYKTISQNKKPIVVLGHNKDDCFENILTNITSQSKYDNLSGMNEYDILNDITFIRPFLNIPKSQIISYAKSKGIPFLYDSTPKWSQRGKIRDEIVPLLDNWNHSCIESFHTLSQSFSETYKLVDSLVDIYLSQINNNKLYINRESVYFSSVFWKTFIKKMFNISISNKSLYHYINRLQKIQSYKKEQIILNISLNVLIFKSDDNFEFIFTKHS